MQGLDPETSRPGGTYPRHRGQPQVGARAPLRSAASRKSAALRSAQGTSTELFCENALETLREALHAHAAILYTPELTARGWELASCVWAGQQAETRRRTFERWMRAQGPDLALTWDYDPFAVDAGQRNRVLTLSQLGELSSTAIERHTRLFGSVALQRHDQARVLLCHGPRLLAWVGLLREQPFDVGDMALFQTLVEPLRQQLTRNWKASSANMHVSLFECLLEAVHEPALVISELGRVEYANGAALGWLDGEAGASEFAELRAAMLRGHGHPGHVVVRLDARGCPGYSLVLRRCGIASRSDSVSRAIRLWNLGGRQALVVQQVASGRSNKEIAAALGCSEVTVERCLTQIFRVSGSQSRTGLIVRLHQL